MIKFKIPGILIYIPFLKDLSENAYVSSSLEESSLCLKDICHRMFDSIFMELKIHTIDNIYRKQESGEMPKGEYHFYVVVKSGNGAEYGIREDGSTFFMSNPPDDVNINDYIKVNND